MHRIVLISTGGTIASRHDPDRGHTVATMSGEDLLRGLHEKLHGVQLEVDEFCNLGSFAIDLPLAFALAQRIDRHLADPAIRGVVVTHGTDTMEESAYLADLVVGSDKPVIFTGAQRAADAPDTDGPRNIADAVRLACAEAARGLGALIVFEQEFHAARDVAKTHSARVDSFASGEHGALGEVDGERVLLYRRPVLRTQVRTQRIEPAVDLIKLVMGADDRLLRCAAASGARAIVLEAFGRGNATPSVTRAVAELVAGGTAVIVTSRSARGRVRPIYGAGGGRDLEQAGAIFAGDLAGPKARILAALLLGAGADMQAMRDRFAAVGG